MDNASFHKGKEMQKLLEDCGYILMYLHPKEEVKLWKGIWYKSGLSLLIEGGSLGDV